jgi:O-antigen/teichoic acid export membrane protein
MPAEEIFSSPSRTISQRVASGASLLALVRFVTRSLDLITLMVLTRYLMPGDFGLIAVAMSVVQIAEALLELPTKEVLLQIPAVQRSHLNTSYTLCLLRGIALGAILCGLSFPLAAFYGDDRLIGLICFCSLAPAMGGLRSPGMFKYFKALQFGPDAFSEFVGKLAALIVSVSLAIYTRSYWAIAVGTVLSPAVIILTSFIMAPFRPALTLRHIGMFRKFIGWGMAGQAVSALNWQSDRFILGKLVPQATLGLFTATRDLAVMPVSVILDIIARPILAALSTVRDENARLASAYSKTTSAAMSVGLPVVCGQALVSPEIVRVILGPHWVASAWIFEAISISLIPVLYSRLTIALFFATGRPNLVFNRNLYDLVFRLPVATILIIQFGLSGAVMALIASELYLSVICFISIKKILGIPIFLQILRPWRAILSVALMAATIQLLREGTFKPDGVLPAIVFLLKAVPLGASAYAVTHLAIWQVSGRPDGIEHLALELAKARLRRMASFRLLRSR